MSKLDLTGAKFGRLTVLRDSGERSWKNVKWVCQCECGTVKTVTASALTCGTTQSCGCYKSELAQHRWIGKRRRRSVMRYEMVTLNDFDEMNR